MFQAIIIFSYKFLQISVKKKRGDLKVKKARRGKKKKKNNSNYKIMMRGRCSNRVTPWFVWIMIILILGNNKIQVQSKNCIAKWFLKCYGNPVCMILCVRKCMKTSPEALCFCNIGCAISKCTNLTTIGI